jgi:hypothetical protein
MAFQIQKPEKEKIEFTNQTNIPVIVSFSTYGEMRPLWFQVGDIKVKIDRVYSSKDVSIFGQKFDCGVVVNDREQRIELTYYRRENVWTIKNFK